MGETSLKLSFLLLSLFALCCLDPNPPPVVRGTSLYNLTNLGLRIGGAYVLLSLWKARQSCVLLL